MNISESLFSKTEHYTDCFIHGFMDTFRADVNMHALAVLKGIRKINKGTLNILKQGFCNCNTWKKILS